jgi:hypothetical protein
MFRDISIVAAIGVTQAVITVYGIILSLQKQRLRTGFVIGLIGAIGIALNVWGAIRSSRSQQALQTQVDRIQLNTEQPPKVTVNVPSQPIPKQHTHVDFVTPLPTQADLFLPYRKGETPSINVRYRNGGDFPIRDGRMKVKIIIIPFIENSIVFRKYRNKLNAESSTILGVSNSHSNIGYHTYYGPALSDEDVTKLNNAEEVLCAIGILDWRDDSGRYETDVAQCVMAEQPVAVGIFNWHVGAENNGEHKLL